jgi:hypothetical protein
MKDAAMAKDGEQRAFSFLGGCGLYNALLLIVSVLTAVFVKQIVRRFHAASLISGTLISFSGLSQTGPAGCQFRVFPDQRCGFCARAVA